MKVIAIKGEENNVLFQHIRKNAYINGEQIIFHNDPWITLQNGKVGTNFDYLLDFGSTPDVILAEQLGQKYVPHPRYSKSMQQLIIAKVNQIYGKYFTQPCFSSAGYGCSNRGIATLWSHLSINARVIVKRENGARGVSQALMDIYLLNDFLQRKDLSAKNLKEQFPTVLFSPTYSDTEQSNLAVSDRVNTEDVLSYFEGDELFVQQFIENIDTEYRVLVAGNKMYAIIRTIKEGVFNQANVDIHSIKDKQKIYVDAEALIPEGALNVISKLGLKFGSVDLFQAGDNWGIFEYSNEFGISQVTPDFINQLYTDYFTYLLNVDE